MGQKIKKPIHNLMRPAEILGILTDNQKALFEKLSKSSANQCPFRKGACTKQKHNVKTENERRRQAFGVCSAYYGGIPHLICQVRHETDMILEKLNREVFGFVNPILLKEIGLTHDGKNLGRFDMVLVDYDDKNGDIVDFGGIESVSFDTTSTAGINRAIDDFLASGSMKEKYAYGINYLHTIKLMIPQIILKGQNLERWGNNYVWVIQDVLYNYMKNLFGFTATEGIVDKCSLHFLTFSLIPDKQHDTVEYTLGPIKSVENVEEFKKKINAPRCSKDIFLRNISTRINRKRT